MHHHRPLAPILSLGYLNCCALAGAYSSKTIIEKTRLKVTLQDLTTRLS
jgi:hypothetical protein